MVFNAVYDNCFSKNIIHIKLPFRSREFCVKHIIHVTLVVEIQSLNNIVSLSLITMKFSCSDLSRKSYFFKFFKRTNPNLIQLLLNFQRAQEDKNCF